MLRVDFLSMSLEQSPIIYSNSLIKDFNIQQQFQSYYSIFGAKREINALPCCTQTHQTCLGSLERGHIGVLLECRFHRYM